MRVQRVEFGLGGVCDGGCGAGDADGGAQLGAGGGLREAKGGQRRVRAGDGKNDEAMDERAADCERGGGGGGEDNGEARGERAAGRGKDERRAATAGRGVSGRRTVERGGVCGTKSPELEARR
jgi:hypothetical protein